MVRAGFAGRMGPLGRRKRSAFPWNASTGTLPAGSTFTRASTAYDYNSSGVLTSFGTDVAPFGYDPISHALKGLLVEPAATNKILQSRGLANSPWVVSGVTVASGETSKFGDSGAYLVTAGTVTNRIEQTVTTVAGQAYFVQALVNAGTLSNPQLRVDNNAVTYAVNFDLVANTSSAVAGTTANRTIIDVGGGWFLVGYSYTPTGTSSIVRLYPNGSGAVRVDAAQHVLGTAMSSFILTTSAAATRAAPVFTLALPYSANNVTFTFDDNTTQTITNVASPYVVPTTLNRPYIKSIAVVPYV